MFITFHSFLLIGTITYKHSDRKCSLYSCVSSTILEYLYCIYKTFSLTQQMFNRLERMLIQHHVLSLNTVIVLTFPFLSCYMYLIYILKQWIVSFTCSDWLLTLRISSAIDWFNSRLWATSGATCNMQFRNKLKTKSNGVLNRMVSITERIPHSFGRNVLAKAKQMPSYVVNVGRKREG